MQFLYSIVVYYFSDKSFLLAVVVTSMWGDAKIFGWHKKKLKNIKINDPVAICGITAQIQKKDGFKLSKKVPQRKQSLGSASTSLQEEMKALGIKHRHAHPCLSTKCLLNFSISCYHQRVDIKVMLNLWDLQFMDSVRCRSALAVCIL